jgi:hypothetical protein
VPVTVIARFTGDPQDIAARYDRQCADLVAAFGTPDQMHGLIAHTASVVGDGVVIVDAWESREDFERMTASKAFTDSLVASGLPQPSIEYGELHNVVRPEVAAAAG